MIDQYVSPYEFRRLMSALVVVVGLIAIAAFFAFLIVPGLRYQANTSNTSTVTAVQGDFGWLQPTDYLPSKKQVIPPIDPRTVMSSTPELLSRGQSIFRQTCATCHGSSGHGDGPGGKGLNPPPRAFTSPNGWKNGTRMEDIFKTLDEGVKGTSMASYSYLSKRDRMALVHYVQSLGPFDHGQSDPGARAALERLFSSVGETIPNKIPVKMAVDALVKEYQPRRLSDKCELQGHFGDLLRDSGRAMRTLAELVSTTSTDADVAQRVSNEAPYNGFEVDVDFIARERWSQLRSCAVP